MLSLSPANPIPTHTPTYHWSPANQRGFIETLATTGNITAAASAVGMSTQAAYAFCARAGGAAFRLGWDAAVLLARRRVEGELLERALEGQEEFYERDADSGRVKRTRVHNGLSMAMLARLDRMALYRNDVPAETAMARIVSQDFDAFLDLIEADGGGAAAMLFVQARDGGLYSLAGRTVDVIEDENEDFANHCQLEQDSADFGDAEDTEIDLVETAAAMSVWFCDEVCEWRTDFPPPLDYDGEEHGRFGDWDYERSLTDEEERIQTVLQEATLKPLHDVAREARERWFSGEAAAAVQAEMAAEAALIEEALERRRAKQERATIEAKAVAEAITVEPVEAELAEITHLPSAYDFSAAYQPDDPNVSGVYG